MLSKDEMGKRIKSVREMQSEKIKNKYTQSMLADDIGVSRSYIGDIESGRIYPNYEFISKMCEVCGISLSFFDDEEKLQENKTKEENRLIINELIDMLVANGNIKDPNNIDQFTADMLINAIKKDLNDKIKTPSL
jgi:transcriptional regulator with XRE-family HTH domain